jgi:hypothetical protein
LFYLSKLIDYSIAAVLSGSKLGDVRKYFKCENNHKVEELELLKEEELWFNSKIYMTKSPENLAWDLSSWGADEFNGILSWMSSKKLNEFRAINKFYNGSIQDFMKTSGDLIIGINGCLNEKI